MSQGLSEYPVSGEHHKEKKNHHGFESFMDVESRSLHLDLHFQVFCLFSMVILLWPNVIFELLFSLTENSLFCICSNNINYFHLKILG